MIWNAKAIATLRRMAKQEESASQIGKALGCTRNAVIGKCHRLGIKLCGFAYCGSLSTGRRRDPVVSAARAAIDAGEHTVSSAAKKWGVSKSALYRRGKAAEAMARH